MICVFHSFPRNRNLPPIHIVHGCLVDKPLQTTAKHVRLAHFHDDVIKWKHFPRYWPFMRAIHRSPVNSPHKGQRRGALMFPLICA